MQSCLPGCTVKQYYNNHWSSGEGVRGLETKSVSGLRNCTQILLIMKSITPDVHWTLQLVQCLTESGDTFSVQ